MSFPNKEDRKRCWDSRDRYWECLDAVDATTTTTGDQVTRCADCRTRYEQACPSQWVKHFDRKRTYLQFKDKIESEGYEPIDDYESSDKFRSNKKT